MNLNEIKTVVDHLNKTSKCPSCDGKYKKENINIIATTNTEGLFELYCHKCKANSIANVIATPSSEYIAEFNRGHKGVSKNDILDVKNFLNTFDGDFKKIFSRKK